MGKLVKPTFKSGIKGLNKLIDTDIPVGSIVLLTGAPGTLKSGFSYNLLSNYLQNRREFGVYITLEQSKESLLLNMKSLKLRKTEKLEIIDFSDIRKTYKEVERKIDIMKVIEGLLNSNRERGNEKLSCFVLDSLTAFKPFLGEDILRGEIFHFFRLLKMNNLTSFILCEIPSLQSMTEYASEYFLSDGIVELGITKIGRRLGRYIQILKLRGTAHKINRRELRVGKRGIEVLGQL